MDVAVVKKLKSEISAVKKDITKNVREDKKLQSDLRREKEKRTFLFYSRIEIFKSSTKQCLNYSS